MKKLFITLLFIITATITYAQDSIKIPAPDSTKLTVGRVYNDVKAGITGLAGALKVGANHVYGVLVKQQVVYAITWLIFTIGWGLLLWYFIHVVNKIIKANESVSDNLAGVVIVTGFIELIGFFFIISHIDTIVGGFANPEYGAIKDILDFVKH